MNMISSETKIAELKPKTFQIPECLGTRINMRLFPEAVESAFSWKHHSHPVVSCVTCWFFIATTITNYHIFLFLSRLYEAYPRRPAARGKKEIIYKVLKKARRLFYLRVLRYTTDHAVLTAGIIDKKI